MNTREETAMKILQDGGYFLNALERHYHGGEKFVMRLRDKNGAKVRGIGYQTYRKFSESGLLKWVESPRSTLWPSRYELREIALATV